MATGLPTASAFKSLLDKHKVADNGAVKMLQTYERLGEDKCIEKSKALESFRKLAATLRKDRQAATAPEIGKSISAADAAAAALIKQLTDHSNRVANDAQRQAELKKIGALVAKLEAAAAEFDASLKQSRPAAPCEALKESLVRARADLRLARVRLDDAVRRGVPDHIDAALDRWAAAVDKHVRAGAGYIDCLERDGSSSPKAKSSLTAVAKLSGEVRRAVAAMPKA